MTSKKLPDGVLEQAVARTKFIDDPLEATFTAMAGWSYDLGFAKTKPNLNGLFDLKILHKLEPSSPGR